MQNDELVTENDCCISWNMFYKMKSMAIYVKFKSNY